MAAPSDTVVDAVPRESPYYGQPIGAQDIRLLTIIKAEGCARIQTERHTLTRGLEFDAISYVWGTDPAFIRAECNGKDLFITPKLQEMLEHLHSYRPEPHRPLWIDAICINQEDADEKATQIPLMHRIFSRAARVIVWLGPSIPETAMFVDALPRLLEVLRYWRTSGTDPCAPGERKFQDWPRHNDPFWTGHAHLFCAEWFTRLWTFQEIALADEAIILCGQKFANWDDVSDFVEYTSKMRYQDVIVNGQSSNVVEGFSSLTSINSYRRWLSRDEKTLPPLHSIGILDYLRVKNVTECIDRIWAVAGLFDEHLQKRLAPSIDYSADARKEYWRTYIRFAKIFIEEKKSLVILNTPQTTTNGKKYLPSWIPDWSTPPVCLTKITNLWNGQINDPGRALQLELLEEEAEMTWARETAVREHRRKRVWILETDSLLRVYGFRVDTISEVIEYPLLLDAWNYIVSPSNEVITFINPMHAALIDWEARSLALARRVFYGTDEGESDIPPEYIMALHLDWRMSERAETAYIDAMSGLRSCDSDVLRVLEFARRERASRFVIHFRSLTGHSFFSTRGGRVGIATPGCKPGDPLCVFYGEDPLHILRLPSAGSSTPSTTDDAPAESMGVAFVPSLMKPEEWEAARLGEDEIFVIG